MAKQTPEALKSFINGECFFGNIISSRGCVTLIKNFLYKPYNNIGPWIYKVSGTGSHVYI